MQRTLRISLGIFLILTTSGNASDLRARINYWKNKRKSPMGHLPPPDAVRSGKLIQRKVGELIVLKSPLAVNVTWDIPGELAPEGGYYLSEDRHTAVIPASKPGEYAVKLWAVKLNVLFFWPTNPPTFIPPTHIALNGRPELIAEWRIVIRR